jgi:hypothetical protein
MKAVKKGISCPYEHYYTDYRAPSTRTAVTILTELPKLLLKNSNNNECVGDSPHIMIIVLMRVNHFIYTMDNIYTIYTH